MAQQLNWMDNALWLRERRAALLRAINQESDPTRPPLPHGVSGARRNALAIIEQRLSELRAWRVA